MLHINQIYINGEFVTPHGSELFDLFNPATETVIGQVAFDKKGDLKNFEFVVFELDKNGGRKQVR